MAGVERENDDALLCLRAKQGDAEAEKTLLKRYEPLVRKAAADSFAAGSETDDFAQEGRIGLLLAIRDYDPAGGPFPAFAKLCVTRQIAKAVKAMTRKKNLPLSNFVQIDPDNGQDPDGIGTAQGSAEDPEHLVLDSENADLLFQKIYGGLSNYEREALLLSMQGCSTESIAEILGRDRLSVSNAVRRARSKAKKLTEKK